MYIYRFYEGQTVGEGRLACEIETHGPVGRIINEYSGYTSLARAGYNPNVRKSTGTEYKKDNSWFAVTVTDGRTDFRRYVPGTTSYGRKLSREYFTAHYMRALADILFMGHVYEYEKEECGTGSGVERITFYSRREGVPDITYTDIEIDRKHPFLEPDTTKLVFWARKNDSQGKVRVYIPFMLNNSGSACEKNSISWHGCELPETLAFYRTQGRYDLFYGKLGARKGVFYFRGEELCPKCAVEGEGDGLRFLYTDARSLLSSSGSPDPDGGAEHVLEAERFAENEREELREYFDFEPTREGTDRFFAMMEERVREKCFLEKRKYRYFYGEEILPEQIDMKSLGDGRYELKYGEICYRATVKYSESWSSDYGAPSIEAADADVRTEAGGCTFHLEAGRESRRIRFEADGDIFDLGINDLIRELEKLGPEDGEGKNFCWYLRQIHDTNGFYPKEVFALYDPDNPYVKIAGLMSVLYGQKGFLKKLKYHSRQEASSITEYVRETLSAGGYIPDEDVVRTATDAYKRFKMTGEIPCFAIMGGAGIGKSTLAGQLCKLFGKEMNEITPSDLKGRYVGHTQGRMAKCLINASEQGAIIFIDEAYGVYRDKFGQEAIEMILPLMAGNTNKVKYMKKVPGTDEEKEEPVILNFVPPVWMAGYEDEMREMLNENPGLYRRMVKLSLKTPSVRMLHERLMNLAETDGELKKHFEANEREIKKYLRWASSIEYSRIFGNYAGVEDFWLTCRIRLTDEEAPSGEGAEVLAGLGRITDDGTEARERIGRVIQEKREEIRRQYKAILNGAAKSDPESGTSRAKAAGPRFEVENDIDTRLADVKGMDRSVSKIAQIVDLLTNRNYYEERGIKLPKGALLVGPPGTGKTFFARALAGEIQERMSDNAKNQETRFAFIQTAATELGSAEKIRALFAEAEEYDFCVLFIDEVDAIGKHRERRDATPHLLIQLMREMDGFEQRQGIFVMAATNSPDILDPALKRPGRFDRIMEVTYPEINGRREILRAYLEKLDLFSMGKNQDKKEDIINEIARRTVMYSPVGLKNLVNEAAILHSDPTQKYALHRKKYAEKMGKNLSELDEADIYGADILEMLERLMAGEVNIGQKEESFRIDRNDGCSATAIHEVGHAMVSLLQGMKPFERISIISRGNALGYVMPAAGSRMRTRDDFLKEIRVLLGGRIAEEIFYGKDNVSVGALQDIQDASRYANDMATRYGMTDEIGPVALQKARTGYLGEDSEYLCSDEFRAQADREVRRIISEQAEVTRQILEREKANIERMAKYIFEKEVATGSEFEEELNRVRAEG